MGFSNGTPTIVTDGLVFAIDAGNRQSYVSGSSTCTSLVSSVTGSLINDTQYSPSASGCWDFDGADDLISCGDMEINGWTGLTVEAWYKAGEDTTTHRRIVSKDQTGTVGAFQLRKNSGDLQWYISDGSWKISSYTAYSEDLNWHHAVGTLLGGTSTLYLDGVEVASVGSVGAIDDSENEEVVIGADSDITDPDREWLGQIANLKIYNKGLSSSEVLQNYNATKERFI